MTNRFGLPDLGIGLGLRAKRLLGEAHRHAKASILLEWDADIPPFEVAWHEAKKALAWIDGGAA